jgi:hypothetical protein
VSPARAFAPLLLAPDLGDAVALCFAQPHGSPVVKKAPRGFEKGFTE